MALIDILSLSMPRKDGEEDLNPTGEELDRRAEELKKKMDAKNAGKELADIPFDITPPTSLVGKHSRPGKRMHDSPLVKVFS